ncbi:hypothetical protein QJS66_01295 [Kocuria rhizophila]|nr:hypothetical protein QJS66_01295 [Kocuria rhizophila]
MVSADAATAVEDALDIPPWASARKRDHRAGARVAGDAGPAHGRVPRFARQYADLARSRATPCPPTWRTCARELFPAEEHTYRG